LWQRLLDEPRDELVGFVTDTLGTHRSRRIHMHSAYPLSILSQRWQ
jgi:hypothetical protein